MTGILHWGLQKCLSYQKVRPLRRIREKRGWRFTPMVVTIIVRSLASVGWVGGWGWGVASSRDALYGIEGCWTRVPIIGTTPMGVMPHVNLVTMSSFMMALSNGKISSLLVLCEGNIPVTAGFPSQRPVTWCFLFLNKQLSKQSRRRWFETPWRSLWLLCNVLVCYNPSETVCN